MKRMLLLLILATFVGTAPAQAAKSKAQDELFEQTIAPVLTSTCLRCHGPTKARSGLRLDSQAALLAGGENGPAVIPGKPEQSLLIQALQHRHETIKMPPGKRLPDAQTQAFGRWVGEGAPWPVGRRLVPLSYPPEQWAFQPLRKVQPPADPQGWSRNPIDCFLLAAMLQHQLEPAAEADRRALLRRVTFDLTGLPPTPEEVEAFVADQSPDAWARVVDRLLASPHYGERWARHWLDVARYADTSGFEADHLYPSAWRYRDYVIRSFNADRPMDRFIQEQVAGDELWSGEADAALATGLYCVGPVLQESAMMSSQLEYEWLTDAADTTAAAFLGLTLGCARCHDHKYDPLTQKDYYGLQAIFAASDRPFPDKVRTLRIKSRNGLLAEVPLPRELANDPRCTLRTEEQTGFHLFHRDEPLAIHRLRRGELNKPQEQVAPAFPAVLCRPPLDRGVQTAGPTQRRAQLAHWLTTPENPLTARVLVNRVWGWHFGQGLVRTPGDFGAQGERPTHPELLDWLARDFMEHGWSLKYLHRLVLLSHAYRMSSVAAGRGLQVDPENRLLWHFPRRRLEAEAIRDALLACAGTLNRKPFGPPVVPPLSPHELTGLFDAGGKWRVTPDRAEHTRRSVYLLVRRTFVHPLLASFDSPELMSSCPRRMQTVVPTQALALLNSPLTSEQAAALARRLLRTGPDQPEQVVERAWQLVFGRPIHPSERKRALQFLSRHGAERREEALAELCLALFNANEFVYLD
jgi:cytochrome c553